MKQVRRSNWTGARALALAAVAMIAVSLRPGPSEAVTGGEETRPEFRGAYLLKITLQDGQKLNCTGVAVRPRIVYTAAHCVLSGKSTASAGIARKVEVLEAMGQSTLATSTSVHVSKAYQSFVNGTSKGDHVFIDGYVSRNGQWGGLSDHAFVVLDRPVTHSASMFDLLDTKGMSDRAVGNGTIGADDVRAYVSVLRAKFFDGNDRDPVFVGFGHTQCRGKDCTGSGMRRSSRPEVTLGKGCVSQLPTLSYLCMLNGGNQGGDSGGPLYLKARDGKRYVVGILSGGDGDFLVPSMAWAAPLFHRVNQATR